MPQAQTNIEEFVAQHSQSDFRHRDQLFLLLRSSAVTCKTDSSLVSCEHLLNIYRRRANHLLRYTTSHAQQLRDDVLALCDALANTRDEHCRLWSFSSPDSDYTVFEGAETGRILGSVLAKDKRLTTPNEWDNLWRETKPADTEAA